MSTEPDLKEPRLHRAISAGAKCVILATALTGSLQAAATHESHSEVSISEKARLISQLRDAVASPPSDQGELPQKMQWGNFPNWFNWGNYRY